MFDDDRMTRRVRGKEPPTVLQCRFWADVKRYTRAVARGEKVRQMFLVDCPDQTDRRIKVAPCRKTRLKYADIGCLLT